MQQMHKQVGGIVGPLAILLELFDQLSADGVLLRLDERVKKRLNSDIDIGRCYLIAQMKLCMSFGHSDQRLDMTYCDWDSTNDTRLSSDISIERSDLILIDLCESGSEVPLGVNEVLLQDVVWHELTLISLDIESIRKQVVGQVLFMFLQSSLLLNPSFSL